MTDQELGLLLGEIKGGVEENGRRLDRHNSVHERLEAKVIENSEGLVSIKSSAAGIAFVISLVVAAGTWLISLWGSGK